MLYQKVKLRLPHALARAARVRAFRRALAGEMSFLKRAAAASGNSVILRKYSRLESVIFDSVASLSDPALPRFVSSVLRVWANLLALSSQPLQNTIPAFKEAKDLIKKL